MGAYLFDLRPRSGRFVSLALTFVVVMLAVGSSAVAQDEVVPESSAVFSGSVDVELVSIDVFVSDRQGHPVVNLSKDDFEVFEDGEPVKISHFGFVGEPGGAVPAGEVADSIGGGPEAVAPVDDLLLPHLVIAFDSRHLTHLSKRRMMSGIREFLAGTSIPHERIMIMNMGHGKKQGFDVVVPFGATLGDLEEGLDHIRQAPPGGRSIEVAYRNVMASIAETHREYVRRGQLNPSTWSQDPLAICRQVKTQWRAEIGSYSSQTTVRVNETVQRLVGLMRLLSGVPGYKSFLYVGGGLELVPGEDLYAYANRICPNSFNIQDAQINTRVEVMRRLADAANAYRISFNAFEASTFQLSMLASPEFRSALYTPGAAIERTRTLNLQNSLVLLARETGGKTLLNSNGFFPKAEVVDEALFSYYSLGYTPPHQGDGKPHNIKIRLKEKNGRQLRYRQSYSQQTAAEKLEDNLMSALALGWSQNPLDVRLGHGVITPIEGKKDNFLVPVSVTIPVTKLVCSPEQEAGSLCRVRLQMRVSDDKDRVSPMFEKVYGIRVHEGTSPDEKITIQLNNKMRPGVHRLAVGVRDETGLATSYVVQSISVADAPQTTAS